ncbi:hypothetical protein CYMTET_30841, partial [Cymbomonas tetramitiformis]
DERAQEFLRRTKVQMEKTPVEEISACANSRIRFLTSWMADMVVLAVAEPPYEKPTPIELQLSYTEKARLKSQCAIKGTRMRQLLSMFIEEKKVKIEKFKIMHECLENQIRTCRMKTSQLQRQLKKSFNTSEKFVKAAERWGILKKGKIALTAIRKMSVLNTKMTAIGEVKSEVKSDDTSEDAARSEHEDHSIHTSSFPYRKQRSRFNIATTPTPETLLLRGSVRGATNHYTFIGSDDTSWSEITNSQTASIQQSNSNLLHIGDLHLEINTNDPATASRSMFSE